MTSLVVRKVIRGRVLKLRLVPVGPRVISEGVLKLERVQVICPACGQQVEAVAMDGRVKGYCAAARRSVDFAIETQRVGTDKDNAAETKATALSSTAKKFWQDPEYRAKQIAVRIGKHPTAETRAKLSAALKRRHKANEIRAKLSATAKNYRQDPEYRGKQSAAHKKLWQDPEYRARQIAAKMGKHLTAETKAKISATVLKRRHNKNEVSHV